MRLPSKITSEPSTVVLACANMLTWTCASRHNCVRFSSSQLPKVLRAWCALYIFTSKCASRHNGVHFLKISTSKSAPNLASRHNGVQFFISHLARWLLTRRFSEPTFRPSGATNHWKNTVFRDVSRLPSLFAYVHLLSSDSFPSLFYSPLLSASAQLCLSSVHIVGSLTSKLPSTTTTTTTTTTTPTTTTTTTDGLKGG